MASDPLFDVKNAFYIGNYQACINEAQKVNDPTYRDEAMGFMYRSYIAQRKYGVVLDDIKSSHSPNIRELKTLAEYFAASGPQRDQLVMQLEKRLQGDVSVDNQMLPLVAGIILANERNFEAALRALHVIDTLEASALSLQCLLKMDRADLAGKELKKILSTDEDATLTQLAQAWYNLYVGGEKLQEAFYIFQELCEKNTTTPLLLNGQAVALICQNRASEAEAPLQEALEKDPHNMETLINMIALNRSSGKSNLDSSNRLLSQIKASEPNNPFLTSYVEKEKEFARVASQYTLA